MDEYILNVANPIARIAKVAIEDYVQQVEVRERHWQCQQIADSVAGSDLRPSFCCCCISERCC